MTDTPAGSPLPGTPGSGRDDVISVAELLARNAAPQDGTRDRSAGPLTGPVLSVGDLLRREGRAGALPAAAPGAPASSADVPADGVPGGWPDIDLPQPRDAAAAAGPQEWPVRPNSGRRRAGAVAGALIAAGSVLGAALYNGASSQESDAQAAADGLFPGIGLPSGSVPAELPGSYLPTTVALSTPLPPTAPGASGWMDVAFPQQRAETPGSAAGTLRAVSGGTGSGVAAAVPAQQVIAPAAGGAASTTPTTVPATTTPSAPDGPTGTGSTGTGSALGGLAPIQALNNPDRPSAANLVDPLTDPGPSSGGVVTGPLQDVTETVRPVGDTVGGVVAPVARTAAPVGELVGGTVSPVTEATRPVTEALQPVTRPVTDTLEPVTTPVLGALAPVTGPVLEGTAPLTDPLLEAVDPVTSLLDTSAGDGSADGDQDSDPSGSDPSDSDSSGSDAESAGQGSSSDDTQPLQVVTQPVGTVLGTVTEPVGEVTSTVTEPVGGVLGGVTGAAGSLLGGS